MRKGSNTHQTLQLQQSPQKTTHSSRGRILECYFRCARADFCRSLTVLETPTTEQEHPRRPLTGPVRSFRTNLTQQTVNYGGFKKPDVACVQLHMSHKVTPPLKHQKPRVCCPGSGCSPRHKSGDHTCCRRHVGRSVHLVSHLDTGTSSCHHDIIVRTFQVKLLVFIERFQTLHFCAFGVRQKFSVERVHVYSEDLSPTLQSAKPQKFVFLNLVIFLKITYRLTLNFCEKFVHRVSATVTTFTCSKARRFCERRVG